MISSPAGIAARHSISRMSASSSRRAAGLDRFGVFPVDERLAIGVASARRSIHRGRHGTAGTGRHSSRANMAPITAKIVADQRKRIEELETALERQRQLTVEARRRAEVLEMRSAIAWRIAASGGSRSSEDT